MPIEYYANNFATTVNQGGGLDGTTTPLTFTVTSIVGAPALPYRVVIDSEIMLVTADTSTSMTATRGLDGTAMATHVNTSAVTQVLTRDGLINQFGWLFGGNTWTGPAVFTGDYLTSAAANLLTSPGFEPTNTDWILGGVGTGAATIDNTTPHAGTWALKQTNPSAGNYGTTYNKTGIFIKGITSLSVSAWIKGSAGAVFGSAGGGIRMTFANKGSNINESGVATAQPSGQASVTVVDFTPTITASYAQYTTTVAVPQAYTWAFIEIYANGTGASATNFIDDIIIAGTDITLTVGSITGSTKGGTVGWADAGTLKWELTKQADQSLGLWDYARGGFAAQFASNGATTIGTNLIVNGFLDLTGLNAYTSVAAGTGVGDKVSLYLSGANGYGFGIQSSRLVAFIPSSTSFAVRVATGSGNASSGTEVFSVASTGNVISTGSVQAAGPLILTTAVSKINPGATSLSLRNNADNADNMLITDLGAVTFRSTVGGITTLTATTLGGTLSTAAQANVTSLGTLTSLTLSGAISGATDITGSGITTGGILKSTGAPSLGSAVTTRCVGGWSTYGPPTGLTGVLYDYGFDGWGTLWVCSVAGTPGTWVPSHPATRFRASVYSNTSTVACATGTWTAINFDTVQSDPNSNFTTGVGSNYVCPIVGRYRVTAATLLNMTTGVAGLVGIAVMINSTNAESRRIVNVTCAANAAVPGGSGSVIVGCSASDVLRVGMFQNIVATANSYAGQPYTWAMFEYLGAL